MILSESDRKERQRRRATELKRYRAELARLHEHLRKLLKSIDGAEPARRSISNMYKSINDLIVALRRLARRKDRFWFFDDYGLSELEMNLIYGLTQGLDPLDRSLAMQLEAMARFRAAGSEA
jgi:hypothetical protein